MKKRILCVVAVVLLIAILPTVLITASAAAPKVYDETYYAELIDMAARLKSAEGRRLILIGNSDIAFGVNGAQLEALLLENGFDYTVCPLGLYGAVGTSAMLDIAGKEMREGDLVIFVVEPLSDVLTTYFGASAYLKCAESDASLLLPLSTARKSAVVGNWLKVLQERLAFARKGEKPEESGAYRKAAFDERCDLTYERAGNVMQLGYDTTAPIDLAAVTVEEAFRDEVNDFIRHAEKVNASVAISFSPMNRSALVDGSDESVSSFFTTVNEAFSAPVISDPNDYILNSGWFYDTNLHLNSAGAEVRTAMLAQDILTYLGCRTAIECKLPGMPQPVRTETAQVEGTQDAFTFAALDNGAGYLVSGLTDTGRSLETLTVPSSYAGKPVVGFAEDALNGVENLVELFLPESVEGLPDRLFAEAPHLQRLVFLHRSTLPQVSAHAFDGIPGLRVFVPAEDYTLYRDGGGCAVNPWEDDLDRIITY